MGVIGRIGEMLVGRLRRKDEVEVAMGPDRGGERDLGRLVGYECYIERVMLSCKLWRILMGSERFS